MKKLAVILILALATFCYAAEEKVIISIDGMTCGGCVRKITGVLNEIEGVNTADVTLKPGQAVITYDSEQTNKDALMQAVAGLGYKTSSQGKVAGEATHCKSNGEGGSISAASASLGKTDMGNEDHGCPTISKCQELNDFHEVMQPLHMSLSAGDYESIRQGYPDLAGRAEAVKNMKCDKTCVSNVKDFEKKRKELLKRVEKLGKACKGDNDKKLAKAFDKMHEAYVDLGNICK